MKLRLLLFTLLFSALSWGQTTVSYSFSAGGAVTGLNAGSPGITLDANIGFESLKNSSGTNPGIFTGQLRLYQNATKGGSIKIYASNGVTITKVVVNASETTGPAGYTVDGAFVANFTASTTYTMIGLSATEVEFYQRDSNSSNRIYVDSFDVTYTSVASTYSITYDGNTNTGGTAPTDATVYNSGDTATVLGNIGSLVKTGFAFNGWNTTSDGSGTAYIAGNTFAISANTTLYAQWLNTSPPVITSGLTASGNQGSPFTYTIVATNTPTSYNATGLPAGLTINTTTGVISGTPTVSGVFNITITATNAIGTATQALVITLNVAGGTIFNPGELVFVGYDGQVNGSNSEDEYLIATLVDIVPGTSFSLVNSRYEAGAAANVRTNKWGGGGNDASEQPYEVKLTYNGVTNIPAGSVLRFETTDNLFTWLSVVDVITETTSTTRTSEFSGILISGNPNISTSGSDQMFLMQGSFTFDGTTTANEANYYLSGTLLHGITNRAAWVTLSSACYGEVTIAAALKNRRESRLPSALTCFNVENASSNSVSAFYENDKQHGLATIRQIVLGISDVANNWTLSSGRYTIDPLSSLTTRAGKTFLIGPSNPAGQWVGNVDTNWFNCANWEGLAVPSLTTNVTVDATALNIAAIDYNATYSNEYSDIAYSKDLIISGSKVQLEASSANILEVHGNIQITNTGVLDMDDSNAATADGTLHLFGNWTNTIGQAAFEEGNGTVYFDGSTPQIINNVTPVGTEVFYNVVMNNNFDTAVSNDLVAEGNLIINAGRTLNIDGNGYVRVNNKLTHNGDLVIQNNGQFIQVNETDTNDGVYTGTKFQVNRTASVRNLDYVYWGSPVEDFAVSNLPNSHRYYWNTLAANANGTQGNWAAATGNMTKGQGYIARASNGATSNQAMNLVFSGKPNNGIITLPIERGTNDSADYDAEPSNPNNIFTTKYDDNWSLVGNPYPSAIDAEEFLVANKTKIEGAVWIWTHGTLPSSLTDPFYDNYVYNYTANDFIKYNGLGATEPDTFAGKIASGQGFMINMLHTTSTPNTIEFNNSFRTGAALANYNNSDFYRTATSSNSFEDQEKHRMWLDVVNTTNGQSDRTLLGYATNATNARDHFYDCFHKPNNAVSFYSLIDGAPFIIQGRSLPFDVNDKVSMGFSVGTTSAVTIAIRKVDGIFSEGQTIYLEDKALSTIHNLTANPYSFTSNAGIFTDRFVIRYTNETLSNPDFIEDVNAVFISSKEGITVTSKIENIQEIEVYDLLGRKLYQNKNIDSQTHLIQSIQKNNSGLILTITLENGKKVIKKTIY